MHCKGELTLAHHLAQSGWQWVLLHCKLGRTANSYFSVGRRSLFERDDIARLLVELGEIEVEADVRSQRPKALG